jgi:outer membrane biosynthesis protein TonB
VSPILAAQLAEGRGDSRIAMWSRLELAEAHDTLKAADKAKPMLETIVAAPTTVLPEGDPIRTAALLRLANIAAAARDSEAAARALAATGLSPEQCALIDVKPQPINASIGSSAFPGEAMRWGTGGYAKVGHDITADGHTTNIRTIIAAPPFVFGAPTEKAVARFRYQPVFRPDNSIGCSGNVQSVRYVM